jgi:hypothetical protein
MHDLQVYAFEEGVQALHEENIYAPIDASFDRNVPAFMGNCPEECINILERTNYFYG